MDKVNTHIEFASKKRDEAALRISDANKIINNMSETLTKLRKSNIRLKGQIDDVSTVSQISELFKKKNYICFSQKKLEKEASDEALTNMNNYVKQW